MRVITVALLDEVAITDDGKVLISGYLVGWVRHTAAGWHTILAGPGGHYTPPVPKQSIAVDQLLRHPDRGGPILLEHLTPGRVARMLGLPEPASVEHGV